MMYRNFECVGMLVDNITYSPDNFDIYVNSLSSLNENETDLYFYHSDHLGSSSFITDATGISTQHLQYLPFGELFVEQRATANYFTPYKFSAKEKDEETGYGYFGARYLTTDFSIWLSVDPMADKYPNISSYAYCNNNPINLIDPDGKEWVDGDGNLIYDTKLNGGRGGYTVYATDNDKKLGNTLQQTKTGNEQFNKLVATGHQTQIIHNKSDIETENGKIKVGKTQNIVDLTIDNGNIKAQVTKSIITIYDAAIDQTEKPEYEIMGTESTKGLSWIQKLAAVVGHEIEHTTDENETIKQINGENASEMPAYNVSDKIIQELNVLNKIKNGKK